MSGQEKNSGSDGRVSSVVVVEKTSDSSHKPYRPNELQDDAEVHHKRSKAPVVPTLTEEIKNVAENSNLDESTQIVGARAISSEKNKHSIAKKLSSSTEKRELSPECIKLETLKSDIKLQKPVPSDIHTDVDAKEKGAEKKVSKKDDEDSITDEIVEMRTTEVTKEHSEWSDDEEAGGLPRSGSRSSRVSRAVRQLFCCGVAYEAPSEDDVSTHRDYPI